MKKSILVVSLGLFVLSTGFSSPKKQERRTARQTVVASTRAHSRTRSRARVKASSPVRTTSSPAKTPAKKSSGNKPSAQAAKPNRSAPVAQRYYQQAPTPDRYREIQQALADKGYLQGAVNGQWGPDSIDALKRFQRQQNLTPSGKLDAVSLIALGLGPHRNLSAHSTPEARPKDENRRPEGSEGP